MTCYLTIIYALCSAITALPGAGHPPCSEGDMVLAVVKANIPTDPELPTGLPVDPGFEVLSERRPAEGCTETPTVIPASEVYPWCVVGQVQREEVTYGEGEEAVTIPALAPYHGVCCRQGCSLAGPGEVTPIGGPIGYAEERAALYAGPPATEPGGGE